MGKREKLVLTGRLGRLKLIPFSVMPDLGEGCEAELVMEEEEAREEEEYQTRLREDFDEALAKLLPLDREVFGMAYGLDGDLPLKKQEIARRLRISRPTVYKRLKNATGVMATHLKPYLKN